MLGQASRRLIAAREPLDARPSAVTSDVVVVDRGTHLILDVVNEGSDVHDLAVDGGSSRTPMLDPNESQRLDLGRVSADMRTLCTRSGGC